MTEPTDRLRRPALGGSCFEAGNVVRADYVKRPGNLPANSLSSGVWIRLSLFAWPQKGTYRGAAWFAAFRSGFRRAANASAAGPVLPCEAVGRYRQQRRADTRPHVPSGRKHNEFLPLLCLC